MGATWFLLHEVVEHRPGFLTDFFEDHSSEFCFHGLVNSDLFSFRVKIGDLLFLFSIH